jgi:hypothetical protein
MFPLKYIGPLVVATVAIATIVGMRARSRRPVSRLQSLDATVLEVPHVTGAISLDGDLDDSGWLGAVARTGGFVDKTGNTARPYSEARLTWGDDVLYLSLYAADEDIRATVTASDGPVWRDDSFHFVFDDGRSERVFDVSVAAVVADGMRMSAFEADGGARPATDFAWSSGAHVSREIDGTLNDASDDDEEWALEIAIPVTAIGLKGEPGERVRFAIHRCDSPKNQDRSCASWGERQPMVLELK